MGEIKTFGAGTDPRWSDSSEEVSAQEDGGAPKVGTNAESQAPPSIPSFKPPEIVTETRVPNLFRTGLDNPDIYTSVIVVQGDDPAVVAEKIKTLRSLLERETEGERS